MCNPMLLLRTQVPIISDVRIPHLDITLGVIIVEELFFIAFVICSVNRLVDDYSCLHVIYFLILVGFARVVDVGSVIGEKDHLMKLKENVN